MLRYNTKKHRMSDQSVCAWSSNSGNCCWAISTRQRISGSRHWRCRGRCRRCCCLCCWCCRHGSCYDTATIYVAAAHFNVAVAVAVSAAAAAAVAVLAPRLLLLLLLLLRPMLSPPCRCCCNRCRYHSNAQLLRNRSQTYLDHHTLDAAGNDEERGTLAPTRNPRTSLSFGSSKYQAGPSTARTSATDFDGFTS